VEGSLRRLAPAGLTLIETLRWEPGADFLRLDAHLARLGRTAARFGLRPDWGRIDAALAGVTGADPRRVRLTLDLAGAVALTHAPLAPTREPWRVAVAPERLRSDDPWLRVKTSERRLYDATRAALPPGVDETLFLNERGEVCEGTITTVFADLGAALVTPPLASGLLPGVLRASLLAEGRARECVLRPEQLAAAKLYVGSSLRGLLRARLVAPGDTG